MRNYLNSHEKTDSTQIRLYDLQVELSIRTLALDGYAQYTNAFDEAAAAEVFKESYNNIQSYFAQYDRTEPTLIRSYEIEDELSARVSALNDYADYVDSYGENSPIRSA